MAVNVDQIAIMQPEYLILWNPRECPHENLFTWKYYPEEVNKFCKEHKDEVKQVINVRKGY